MGEHAGHLPGKVLRQLKILRARLWIARWMVVQDVVALRPGSAHALSELREVLGFGHACRHHRCLIGQA